MRLLIILILALAFVGCASPTWRWVGVEPSEAWSTNRAGEFLYFATEAECEKWATVNGPQGVDGDCRQESWVATGPVNKLFTPNKYAKTDFGSYIEFAAYADCETWIQRNISSDEKWVCRRTPWLAQNPSGEFAWKKTETGAFQYFFSRQECQHWINSESDRSGEWHCWPANQGGSGFGGFGLGLILSDQRFKTDVQRIGHFKNGLPVYRYRIRGSSNFQVGVMAQEVRKKIPEAVKEFDGVLYVDYARIP
ncbi:MAG: tail fiber domain-containing protein [Planctomycetota bacterium]|jgi:hypothetical protein